MKDGLGNQLFQYAAARALAEKLKTRLKIDSSTYKYNPLRHYSLHHFSIEEQMVTSFDKLILRGRHIFSRVLNKVSIPFRKFRYFETDFAYNPGFLNIPDNSVLEGYFQSEQYFCSIETLLRKELVVKDGNNSLISKWLAQINSCSAVSIHIRRGDYVSDATVHTIHGVCDTSYYHRAVKYIAERISNPVFFIFSDDIGWAVKNFVLDGFPAHYLSDPEIQDFEELRLMYSCRHNIIANSSFSWWGAWLNQYEEKIVIAPRQWFNEPSRNSKDIVPPKWTRL